MAERSSEFEVLDAVAGGLVLLGPDRRIVHWNLWMAIAASLPAADVVGKLLKEALPESRLEAVDNAIESALRSGASTMLTNSLHPALLPLKTRTGRALYHDVMVTPLGDPPARRCLVQVIDVSNVARREKFLRDRQNARYDSLVESAPDVIMTVDGDGIIRLANPAAARQFGYPADELVGRKATELFDTAGAWSNIWRDVTSGFSVGRPVELQVRRKDGSLRYFEVSAARWMDGKRFFVTTILRDVSDRRAAEAALRESERESRGSAQRLSELNEILEKNTKALSAVDRRKDEFLATLAHELRNPLAPLRNGLQLLKLAKDDSALIERTRHMMDLQLGQMVRLIDDLLDVSRINKDMIELSKELTTLDKVIRQAVETSGPLIDVQQHKLDIDIPGEEILLDADVVRLTQVFANLLNNAAKYTPKGGHIAIKVRLEGESVAVSVTDNGIGIPADMLSKVFDMFTQVDSSLERSQGGLGIGLSLVKRLVAMHGGSVEAASAGVARGSEFTVRLPVARKPEPTPDPAARKTEARPCATSRRILVVDDNQDSATTLSQILSMMGHDTRTAHDGLAALEVAEGFEPEVALLDLGMPKLNGYDTARRLREKPWGRQMLLVALTGWGQEEDRRRSSDAGFNTHLVKPVDIGDIERLLERMRAH